MPETSVDAKTLMPEREANERHGMIDTVVVGGGCAGLYCAWRLSTQPNPKSVYVFEKANKPGGRLLSVDLLLAGGRKAELGGMRFTERQRIIWHLIKFLERQHVVLKDHPLAMRKFNFETSLMFLRGKRLYLKDPSCPSPSSSSFPYNLEGIDVTERRSEDALTILKFALSSCLQSAVDDATVKGNKDLVKLYIRLQSSFSYGSLTAEEWRSLQEQMTINGIPLHSLGFWNLLQHCLKDKSDAFLFLHDALGYESLVANSNAAQAIPNFLADFDVPADGYYTLKGGMDALPRLLSFYSEYSNESYVLADHHTVKSVRLVQNDDSGQFFEVEVKCTPTTRNKDVFYTKTYRARRVILALPKAALKAIQLYNFPTNERERFVGHLDEVTAHPAFKLFLVYKTPWWTDLPLKARATTDLPIRQVYYLGETIEENTNEEELTKDWKDKAKAPALVTASYSDEHYVDFWDPLVRDPERQREIRKLREVAMWQRDEISAYAAEDAASQRIVEKAREQLAIMHGNRVQPSKIEFGVVKEWTDAWHFWNAHVKPWETAKDLTQPFNGLGLFVVVKLTP